MVAESTADHAAAASAGSQQRAEKRSSSNQQHADDAQEQRKALQSALRKLTAASLLYNPARDDSIYRNGFTASPLSKLELKDMLRRLFAVKLSASELTACYEHFATAPSSNSRPATAAGTSAVVAVEQQSRPATAAAASQQLDARLCGSAFILEIVQMGHSARDRQHKEHCEKERQQQQRAKAQAAAAEQETAAAAERGLNTVFTADDLSSALQKVTDAAVSSTTSSVPMAHQGLHQCMHACSYRLAYSSQMSVLRTARLSVLRTARYDKNHPSAMSLEAFEGAKMTAPVFKEQLKRVFHIKLTAAELAALMRHFDQDGDGNIEVRIAYAHEDRVQHLMAVSDTLSIHAIIVRTLLALLERAIYNSSAMAPPPVQRCDHIKLAFTC
eukprot:2271-Heterococcus_DN1.PRE.4